jgi:IS30 family transposase
MTKAEINEALQLNDEGVPIADLTKLFNRSWKTIAKELRAIRGSYATLQRGVSSQPSSLQPVPARDSGGCIHMTSAKASQL